MAKVLLLLASLIVTQLYRIPSLNNTIANRETYVYVCTGPNAKKYHSTSECRGLKNCSKEVKTVTLSYALEKGKTKCGICYKKEKK